MYNWEGKEEICYRMYVEERRHLDEVVEYFQKKEGFKASKRAFQVQFKRWDFPSKQNPAHKNPALIDRVKQLWETNVRQKEMLEILEQEGFRINDRELMRLRIRFRWLLRKSTGHGFEWKKRKRKGSGRRDEPIGQLGDAIMEGRSGSSSEETETDAEADADSEAADVETNQTGEERQGDLSSDLDPEVVRRRELRQAQLQAESDELWRKRKRRRRTRGYAGMGPDPKQPPRFPSETTIDESKAFLGLDNNMYRQIRDEFQAICQEDGVVKKTTSGPEKWKEVQDRLIQENPHLVNIFENDPEDGQEHGQQRKAHKALCLDVICLDVTKRMRTMSSRMSLLDAKNILELNPEESRQVRQAFYDMLRANHFTNKLEMGLDLWNQIKSTWMAESDLLQQRFALDPANSKYELKQKATDILCRDVMKRFRGDQTKKDPAQKRQVNQGPGPGPAPASMNPNASSPSYKPRSGVHRNSDPQIVNRNTEAQMHSQNAVSTAHSGLGASDLQIDPSLLLAASHDSIMQDHSSHYVLPDNIFGNTHQTSFPLPIYFRLHPHSTTQTPGKHLWLSVLQSGTVSEIRSLAMREHPGTIVMKIEGAVKERVIGQPDREMTFVIDEEEELQGYLAHVIGGKVTFIVLLALAQGQAFM